MVPGLGRARSAGSGLAEVMSAGAARSGEVVLMRGKKMIIICGIVVGLPLVLWIGWGLYVITTTERPAYKVRRQLAPNVEIRQYEAQTWIATDYQGDDSSFRVLASYIFGGNREGQKVAMTAPVITDERMAFILPGGTTRENAPQPEGQPIEFTEVPPRKLATLRFGWTTPESRVTQKTEELLAILESEGVETKGRPFLMRYNDPWTPPFMRRNEVAIEVE
jgi:hypothetical protein